MSTHRLLIAACLGLSLPAGFADAAEFADPVRMQADGQPIRVESPGHACPAWTDIDGDGDGDLVVGQFMDGKMQVFENRGDGTLAAGTFLMAEGEVATVPGIS